jgi:hypothetical protein
MTTNTNQRRWQLMSGRLPMASLTVAAALLGLSEVAPAGDSAADTTQAQSGNAASQALLKKMDAMEQRIRSLEAQLKQKDAPPRPKAGAETAAEGKPRSKTSRTVDLAASAPAADAAAETPPSNQKTSPDQAGKSDQSGKSSQPANSDQSAKSDQPGKSDKSIDWDKAAEKMGEKPILGIMDSPVTGLAIGAYGEMMFGAFQNPAAGGQWQGGADIRRMVLLPTYAITENIIFNAELEWEHGGFAPDADDKVNGEIAVEQLWVDFKIVDQFNWRAPGIDLIPIGYINEHHEPTQFYSVLRPEIYNGLIPSTWSAPASSIYGSIADGLGYQIMVSSSIEDFGGDFSTRTDANTVPPFPIGYPAGINGLEALALARPTISDFRQLSNTVAVAGRLDYAPPSIPGFAGSTSAYFTPNTTPRGADADNGMLLGRSSLTMVDSEFRYHIPNTGFELRGEGVFATFGNPANLRANNDSDPTDNVGKTMYGASGEIAYHIPLGTILHSEWEAVPFYRYTYENLQTSGFAGTDVNAPTGAGQLQFHNVGVAVFPSPKLLLKATYQKVINRDPVGANADSILGGAGFFF